MLSSLYLCDTVLDVWGRGCAYYKTQKSKTLNFSQDQEEEKQCIFIIGW